MDLCLTQKHNRERSLFSPDFEKALEVLARACGQKKYAGRHLTSELFEEGKDGAGDKICIMRKQKSTREMCL